MPKLSDEQLWKVARKRAGFKRHLSSYVLINLFLWAIWWFTLGRRGIYGGPIPWPAWVTLGWGLGLGFNYFEAYGPADNKSAVEEEYERLKRQQAGE